MNKIFPGFLIFFISVQMLFSAEFSASAKRLYGKLENGLQKGFSSETVLSTSDQKQFLIRQAYGVLSVRALIWVSPSFSKDELDAIGVRLDRLDGEFGSVTIPLGALSALSKISSIRWVEIDMPLETRLDFAAADVRANLVRTGSGLSSPHRGEGVIVGVIDNGFDYTHPVFQDASGALRIATVWDQLSVSGLPPSGYSYGSEWKTSNQILNQKHDNPLLGAYKTHGTHVASIACGRAADQAGKYWGMASEARVIFVSLGGGASNIFDAIEYIFDFADAAGQPAVVNMSIGSHTGPHDGTSILDRYFDRSVGAGKILVGAAGNEGNDSLHIAHTFTGDTIGTAPVLQNDGNSESGLIEMWGAPNTSFSVSAGLFDKASGQMIYGGDFTSSNLDRSFQATYHIPGGGTLKIDGGAVKKTAYNDRPNIQLELTNNTTYQAVIAVTASSGMVHLWNISDAPFRDLGHPEYFVKGDGEYSVGEVGGTSKSVISVGAYVTKTEYHSIDGFTYRTEDENQLDGLAAFSSHGPTVDGRVKPDITAPGEIVVAAASSESPEVTSNEIVEKIQNKWPLAAFGGTSMSSPMVAGIVALMLDANPSLTPAQILSIFKNTARQDAHTGTLPSGGSNLWGVGKVDALAAVQTVEPSDVVNSDQIFPKGFKLYQNTPNPFNPSTQISFYLPKVSDVRLSVIDLTGRAIATVTEGRFDPGDYTVVFDASSLASGVYFYRLQAGVFQQSRKLMVLK